ncbi:MULTISPECIES: hypothetical protein [unclassified Roseofilum]|uniref:hypothetical protein n=1 Tax=unclassified Roseofilum TaxID=2620099 RepID=UPI000E810889|nr:MULTISPECIES: hypothetical protein [unclassified Roseofilum]MBP0011329.1 hypothetical protein [Roseofilum sp. Belize Diploria]MBP0035824.1 hypothetical protein [Roseofilum sp. Belize BBD 4]HBQ99953.1 hypothetical protein [Cyanobacteria bacterium UBA11691]
MMNIPFQPDRTEIDCWKHKIDVANEHNVFCHCHQCGYEWVIFAENQACPDGNDRYFIHFNCPVAIPTELRSPSHLLAMIQRFALL